jgi:hypothetical protein
VRSLPRFRLLVWLCVLAGPTLGLADDTGITRDLHPWGRFYDHKGAWKRCRVTTETLDERGAVVNTSVTETKTSLEDVDGDGVTLRVESTAEIAGKQLPSEPKKVRQSFRGDWSNGKAVTRKAGVSRVTVDGETFLCRVEETEVTGVRTKTVTRTYYSRTIAPYVLKRESKTTDLEGKTTLEESTLNVISLDRPCKIYPRIKRAAWVEAVSTTAQGRTVTRAFMSIDVPGGVVWHVADELDKNGRLLRRSSLVMVDYGLDPDEDDSRPPDRGRGRSRRSLRSGS